MANIDNLVIKIEADSKDAIKAINDVSNALKNLGKLPELKAFKTLTGTMKEITKQNEAYAKSLVAESKIMSAQAKIAEAKAKAELVQSKIEQTNARTAQIKARTEQANIKAEQTRQKIAEQTDKEVTDYTKRNEIDDESGVTLSKNKGRRLENRILAQQMKDRANDYGLQNYSLRNFIDDSLGITGNSSNIGKITKDTSMFNDKFAESVKSEEQAESTTGRFKSKIDEIKDAIDRLLEKFGLVNKKVESVHKSSNSLFARIKRIIGYRIIRGAFNQIISAIKTGVNNVILFDKAMNEAFGRNRTMSNITSMLTNVKNAFGELGTQLLSALEPAIISVSNALITVVEKISKMVAVMRGETSYLAVNRDYWADYGDTLNSVKRTLLGFDELNVLSGSQVNYNDMFIDTKLTDEEISQAKTLNTILGASGIIGTISALLGAFSKKDKALETQTSKTNAESSAVQNLAKVLGTAGLLGTVTGVISGLSGKSLFDGNPTKEEVGGAVGYATEQLGVFETTVEETNPQLDTSGVTQPISDALGTLETYSCTVENTNPQFDTSGVTTPVNEAITSIQNLEAEFSNLSTQMGEMEIPTIEIPEPDTKEYGQKMLNLEDGTLEILQITKQGVDEFAEKSAYNVGQGAITMADNYRAGLENMQENQNNFNLGKTLVGIGVALGTVALAGWAFSTGGIGLALAGLLFAGGGMPSYGSMFIAGEQGSSAEIVGQFGGRTNVINQEQLTYSMREANRETVNAIYAMANAIVSSVDNIEMPSIRIGDREIYNASQRGKKIVGSSLVQGV